MRPDAKTPSHWTGIFATLRATSGAVRGTGALSQSHPRLRGIFIAALALGALALTAAPASARPYESQITEANGQAFGNPIGLAVDGSDNLWVSDNSNGVVDKFNSSGGYEAQGSGPPFPGDGEFIESLAFSAAAGKVFVSDSWEGDLWGLNPADASYTGTDLNSGLGGGCCYIRVAADNSAGAAAGDLYVSTEGTVVRIDGSGAPADFTSSELYVSGNVLSGPTGPFSEPGAVAVAPNGTLYVAGGNKVYAFEPSGDLIGEITEFEGAALGQVSAIAVDPTSENVVVSEGAAIDEFTATGGSLANITEANGEPLGNVVGLAIDSSGRLYAADDYNSRVDVLGPAPPLFPLEIAVTGVGTVKCEVEGGPAKACKQKYPPGTQVRLHPEAAPGFEFTEWLGDCTGANCELTMAQAHSVTAVFGLQPGQKSLTVSKTGKGSGSLTCNGVACAPAYPEGTSITLEAVAAANSRFAGFGGTGSAASCTGSPCTFVLAANSTVSAPFNLTHTLAVTVNGSGSDEVTSSPAGIACGATCSASFVQGETVVLTATSAAPSAEIWSGCTDSSGNICEIEIGHSDAVVNAAFTARAHTLTITPAGPGSISASSGAVANCSSSGGTCSGPYAEGSTITLTASPAAHSSVAWGGCTRPSANTCEIEIGASDASISATFAVKTSTLSISKVGSGTGSVTSSPAPAGIACGQACSARFADGSTVTLSATPAAGSEFVGFSGAGCAGAGACQLTLEEATTVTAQFRRGQSAAAPTEGRLEAAGSAAVSAGRAALELTCSAGPCQGTLELTAKVKQGHGAKSTVIGRASYSLAAGSSQTLMVKLSAAANGLLKQGKAIRATLSAPGLNRTLELKPGGPKRPKHHQRGGKG